MEQITINKLAELCEEQKRLGNGEKMIVVSADPEGNEFNGLFGGFAYVDKYIFGLLGDTHFNRDYKQAKSNLIALGVF